MSKVIEDKRVKIAITVFIVVMLCIISIETCQAADVSSVIQSAWKAAETQIKNVVNNVIFPVIDIVLAVFFFVKLGTAYFDYRKQGQFEWTAPAILFACLCFTLTAPNYIWNVLG